MTKQDQKQKLLEILLKDIPEAEDVEILFSLIPNIKDTKTYTYTLPIVELRLASILYTFSDAMSILKKFNFAEKIIDDVHFLIQHLFFQIETQDVSIFNLLKTLPEHLIHLLFSLKRAYALSQQRFEEIHSIDSIEAYVTSYIQRRKNITIR
ncbi:MAG: hypothetical protein K2I42_05315, partial [Anaeroplasmataceae bacterium]|nr:hypothetical protein [Anaeroplasmataceae bacterium]